MRKIIHIDMDAFYASVEQRDDASLRGRPVAVAWRGARSVVCAASYEARGFGVRSAMPALRAHKLCPELVFVPPDFPRYREVSRQVRAIFARYTPLVEPLSLDEAYLDVTRNLAGTATATELAARIRGEIRTELSLTASAGIAPNKFLAKIASDWRKPDGQFVIKPHQLVDFLTPLPVGRIPGVGRVMQARLKGMGIETVGELRAHPAEELVAQFGRYGRRLHDLARGRDERPVEPNQPVQSVSAEDTFASDRPLADLVPDIARLADKVWASAARKRRVGRTVVLKLKTADFQVLTRSFTPSAPPEGRGALRELALGLLARVQRPPGELYRLVGVGLSNFRDPEELPPMQPGLFDRLAEEAPDFGCTTPSGKIDA